MKIRHPYVYATCQYLAVSLVTLLILVQPARAASDTLSMNAVAGGELLFQTDSVDQYVPAVQLHSHADIDVSGIVATVDIVQRFKNTTRDWAEGVYVFPLPESAAVNTMELRIGERLIVAEIREKKQARREYQQAQHAGKKAALVEQRRPNLFATAVANIAPGEEVEVRLTYIEKARYANGRFSLRFPMTITPRYIPGTPQPSREEEPEAWALDEWPLTGAPPENRSLARAPGEGWALNTDQVPDAEQITPLLTPRRLNSGQQVNPIELSVTIDAGLPLAEITSAYHEIHVVRQTGIYEVSLAAGTVPMDRDFELTWKPVVGTAPEAILFTEERDGENYALAMILPPEQSGSTTHLPRETVFIIDTSGSMGGEPILQARAALTLALSRLAPDDRFNIIAFNDSPTMLFTRSVRADATNLDGARRWVEQLQAGGGTEMLSALRAAFTGQREDTTGYLRQIIFITDGAVGNEDALFKAIADHLGDRRLFTVGIGAAPNSHFMRKAAQFGRGTFTYVGRQSEVEEKMDHLFALLEKPMLRNIALDWPGTQHSSVTPDPVPDLYAGQPIIVTAKLERPGRTLNISGETANGPWQTTLTLDAGQKHSGVAALWARDRITDLDDQIALQGETAALRENVLTIALQHRLVSRYTSFVAVEKKISRPEGQTHRARGVANLKPHGQSMQPYAYPQTATTAAEAFWLGLLGIFATFCLWLRIYTLRPVV